MEVWFHTENTENAKKESIYRNSSVNFACSARALEAENRDGASGNRKSCSAFLFGSIVRSCSGFSARTSGRGSWDWRSGTRDWRPSSRKSGIVNGESELKGVLRRFPPFPVFHFLELSVLSPCAQ